MELRDQPALPTLARRLGDTAHFSGLAIRLAGMSGAGERLPEWLMKIAVLRGASHYRRDFDPTLPPDDPRVADEEVGIALCLEQHVYNLDQLRAAAQLLSSRRVDLARLGRLAVQERCEPVLLHIAAIAEKFAPAQEPGRDALRASPSATACAANRGAASLVSSCKSYPNDEDRRAAHGMAQKE